MTAYLHHIVHYIKEYRMHFFFWLPFVVFVMVGDSLNGSWWLATLGLLMILASYGFSFYVMALYIMPITFGKKAYVRGFALYVLLFALFLGYCYLEWYHIFPAWKVGVAWAPNAMTMMRGLAMNFVVLTVAATGYFKHRESVYIIEKENARQQEMLRKENELLVREKEMLAKYYAKRHDDHLTFNVLNNIYSQVYKKVPEAGETIHQFANFLRYGFRSEFGCKVPLQDEIQFIDNYINLQKSLKHDLQVIFNCEGKVKNVRIVPRILVSFVENAIKYGATPVHPISVTLTVNGAIHFTVHNHKSHRCNPISTGMGQEIVKELLNVHYGDQYTLHITNQEEDYLCQLTIPHEKMSYH